MAGSGGRGREKPKQTPRPAPHSPLHRLDLTTPRSDPSGKSESVAGHSQPRRCPPPSALDVFNIMALDLKQSTLQ